MISDLYILCNSTFSEITDFSWGPSHFELFGNTSGLVKTHRPYSAIPIRDRRSQFTLLYP